MCFFITQVGLDHTEKTTLILACYQWDLIVRQLGTANREFVRN